MRYILDISRICTKYDMIRLPEKVGRITRTLINMIFQRFPDGYSVLSRLWVPAGTAEDRSCFHDFKDFNENAENRANKVVSFRFSGCKKILKASPRARTRARSAASGASAAEREVRAHANHNPLPPYIYAILGVLNDQHCITFHCSKQING